MDLIYRVVQQKQPSFIVTHNKQTMNAVNFINGITIQERGVSKFLPVDFKGLEEMKTEKPMINVEGLNEKVAKL